MFRGIIFSAAGAGLAVCLAITVLQVFTTEPLILHAEAMEQARGTAHNHDDGAAGEATTGQGGHHDLGAAWKPADGFDRTAFTALANLLMGIAVSAILLSLMLIKGERIDARHGLLWGAAGFVAASLLPSLGLPPELPGPPSADLFDRQVWWLATAAASAIGLALIVLGRQWVWRAVGVAVLVAPHVIGAPLPPVNAVGHPGGLAGDFVIASLVVSAALWMLAGTTAGWLHQHLAKPA